MKKIIYILLIILISGEIIHGENLKDKIEIGVNVNNFKKTLFFLKDLNIHLIRYQVRWGEIEPYEDCNDTVKIKKLRDKFSFLPSKTLLDADGFYWKRLDEVVKVAIKNRIDILFLVRSVSLWGTVYPPEKNRGYLTSSMPDRKYMKRWLRFLKKIVERYKNSKIKIYIEIENEVNSRAFWKNGDVDSYLSLLKKSYKYIKKVDKNVKVLSSALACGITHSLRGARFIAMKNKFNEELKKIISTNSYDILSVHNYYYPCDGGKLRKLTYMNYLKNIEKNMKDENFVTPVWVTEFGYISKDKKEEASQLKKTVNALKISRKFFIEKMFLIMIKDRNEYFFGNMGLITKEGRKKKIYNWLKSYNQY